MCFNCAMEPDVVTHTFNLITQEAEVEAGGSQESSRPDAQQVPGQPELCLKNQTKTRSMRWNKFPSKTLLKTYLCKPKKLN